MFRTYHFAKNADSLSGAWQLVAIIGGLLTFSAVLIFVLPELVAYLIAALLFWGGVTLLGYAYSLKKQSPKISRKEFWEVL